MTIEEAVMKLKPSTKKRPRHGLSSGSTLLNLACSNDPDTGFYTGRVYHIVGDSSAGKTAASLTCLAEAHLDPFFDDYALMYDDAENGAEDLVKLFGKKIAARIRPPRGTKKEPIYSEYLEDFYDNLDDLYQSGKPFIYVVDSMDVLWPRDDEKKYQQQKKVRRKNALKGTAEKETGSMGMAKAKRNSELLRVAVPKIRKSGSIVIIISQAKTSMEQYGDGKTNAGGLSLKFYASLQMWLSIREKIKKKIGVGIKKREREIGIRAAVRIKKNRQNGKNRTVVLPMYHASGFDDIGGMVEYLIEEGHWKKGKGGYNAKDFGYKGSVNSLVKRIEENDDVPELKAIVKTVWEDIEAQCNAGRRNKYV